MKASVVKEFGAGFVYEDVELANPIGAEVLVDVQASGLCHSDLTASKHNLGYDVPAVFGHEVAGIVTEIGPNVTEFQVGDHVVGCLVQFCGKCVRCLSGRVTHCERPEATLRTPTEAPRITINGTPASQGMGLGGFAEKALIHENQLVKIDKRMPFPQAALLGCGVVTGAGAVINTANVQAGESVAVIGVGGVGLNAINGAVVAGAATIIAIDIADDKLEKAKKFGATHVINSTKEDPIARVKEITDGGADAVFDVVGFPEVTAQGLGMVGKGGGLYLIGIGAPDATLPVSNMQMLIDQKKIQGVYMGSSNHKRDIPMYAKLYLEGRFNLDDLISKEISLSEVQEGYESLRDSSVTRVVITKF